MSTHVYSRLLPFSAVYAKNVYWYRNQFTLKRANALGSSDAVDLQVLFKSKHFVVVNKPFDMIMYSFAKNSSTGSSLLDLLREKYPIHYDPRLQGGFHVLHRLDSVTSGCLCVPLNYYSQRMAVEAFQKGLVDKEYLALVWGRVETNKIGDIPGVAVNQDSSIDINVLIGEDKTRWSHARCAAIDRNGDKSERCVAWEKASTRVRVLNYGTYKGRECTKVSIRPLTGKRHQIRVHLAHIGHGVVGDLVYSGDADFDAYRTMLHSYRLDIDMSFKKKGLFIKSQATDPFVTHIDPDWIPSHQ